MTLLSASVGSSGGTYCVHSNRQTLNEGNSAFDDGELRTRGWKASR